MKKEVSGTDKPEKEFKTLVNKEKLTKKTTKGEQMPPILEAMEHTPIPTFL